MPHSTGVSACDCSESPKRASTGSRATARPPYTSAVPASAPANESSADSSTSSPTMVRGPAPIARSTAISRRRASSDA